MSTFNVPHMHTFACISVYTHVHGNTEAHTDRNTRVQGHDTHKLQNSYAEACRDVYAEMHTAQRGLSQCVRLGF